MKRYGKLYKRNTNGSTNVWEIISDGDRFWTEEGQLGGVISTSKPTICVSKNTNRANETSPEEQAIAEAKAKIEKKQHSGYTSNIKDIDTAVKYFKPMLCEKLEDYTDKVVFSNGVYVQPKLDGMRCICQKSGMTSRNGKDIVSAPHLHKALKPLFDKYPNLIFDGELYCDKYKDDFNSIISLVKKTKPNAQDLKDSEASIQYWIYDLPSYKDIFSVRTAELKKLLKEIKSESIVFVETHKVNDKVEMDNLYGSWLSSGYEGQIVRLNAVYENKRSRYIYKRKEFVDSEYVVTGVEEGLGNRAGTLGNVSCVTEDGKPFKSNIKGNFAYVTQLWKDRKSLIGKTVTVKYFSLTPDGIPRFPYVIAIRDYE